MVPMFRIYNPKSSLTSASWSTIFHILFSTTDWEQSFIVGKGDALDRGNYVGLKLTDRAGHEDHREDC